MTGYEELIRNPHHFGRDGILEYFVWHEHALLLAARAGRLQAQGRGYEARDALVDAIVHEAYASHFLQDFFAPGHVQARETARSLTATLKEHDYGNMTGETFWLTDKWYAIDAPSAYPKALGCLRLPHNEQETVESLRNRECRSIHLEGDGRVYRSDANKVYKPAEAVFLTLVTALSLQDLLAVYEQPELDWGDLVFPPTEARRCDGGFRIDESRNVAWLSIGYFGALPEECTSTTGAANAVVEYETPDPTPTPGLAFGVGGTPSPVPHVEVDCCPIGAPHLAWLPRTAFDVTLQRLNEESRKTIGGEVFLDWWTLNPFEDQTVEWSLGYTYVRGNSYDGSGPDATMYYRVKNLYLWGSVSMGWRFLQDLEASSNAPRAALRIGFGPEVVSVFAGIAADSSISNGEEDFDPTTFELGVKIIPPWQRLWAVLERRVR